VAAIGFGFCEPQVRLWEVSSSGRITPQFGSLEAGRIRFEPRWGPEETLPILGNISSHVDLTSGAPRHQANN
jgi:hypothetical protein